MCVDQQGRQQQEDEEDNQQDNQGVMGKRNGQAIHESLLF